MDGVCGVEKAPCKSCPYRQDVPSGVWAQEEYETLPKYDGEIIEQLMNGGTALFMCHQQDGNLCAGWLATHGSDNLLALRLNAGKLKDEVWGYTTKVPVFASGAEAAAHGMAEIEEPGEKAKRVVSRLSRKLGL
jgi:hypothetical protein